MATKVVTANLRRTMSWPEIEHALLRLLERNPGVIGFQEIYGHRAGRMKRFLAKHGYGFSEGNEVPIAFDKSRYQVEARGKTRLPGQPEGHRNPARFGNWVALRDTQTGERNVFTNTHLNHGEPGVQRQQIHALAQMQRQLHDRFGGQSNYYLTGDMNTGNRQELSRVMQGTGLRTSSEHGVDWLFSSRAELGQRAVQTGSDHRAVVDRFGPGGSFGSHGNGGGAVSGDKGGKGHRHISDAHAHIEEEYGLSYALFNSDPELKNLLHQAQANSWTATRFQVALRNTDWFKKHSDTWRQFDALRYSDPQTYQQRLQEAKTMVGNLAGEFSANLSPQALNRISQRALYLGWTSDQVKDVLAKYITPSSSAGGYGGDLSAIEQQLRTTALNNGVHLYPNQIRGWMQHIVRGQSSTEQYQNYIRKIAAQSFPVYAEQINGGMDLADIAAPYVQSMSSILEMNPNAIDMYDPTIRKALAYRNDKGEAVPMSITHFEDSLRQDPRWQYTDQAKQTARGIANSLAKMWGLTS